MASHTKLVNAKNNHRSLQVILIVVTGMLLVMLSFMIAFKVGIALYPFESEQQLIVDYIYSPAEYEQELIYAGASALEMDHLNDVNLLVTLLDLLIFPELLLLVLLMLFASRFSFDLIKKILNISGIGGMIISFVFTFFTVLFFDLSFDIFHKILFPQGNYQFAFNSYLISTLPADLFFLLGVLILLLVVVINIGYIIAGMLVKLK
ncbi:DUF1461 domain-containing protein [archaeon]|nr:DUF1461 domain-containing protein [archaeon]MBT6761498.1 DUF1461 domain-containing protein [archaeon]